MYDKQYFINSFKELGLKETDTVLVHSSYKSVAGDIGIEGGADTLLNAFIEYFGQKGLVVFPTLTWKLGNFVNDEGIIRSRLDGPKEGFYEYGNDFDVRTTTCAYLGVLPEKFRQREGVVRSLCPTHSVAAYGPDAKAFCSGHEKAATAMSWDSPWGRLYERKAKILFLGTGIGCNTFMHAIEEHADIPGLQAPYIWKFTVTDYEGNCMPVAFKRHVPHHNWYYHKMEPEFLEHGIARKVLFGSAETYIIDAVAETDYMLKRLKEEPQLFTMEYNQD